MKHDLRWPDLPDELAREPLVVDCDPGTDDALALLLLRHFAGNRPIAAISAQGNMPLTATSRNLALLSSYLEAPWSLYEGTDGPCADGHVYSDGFHGSDGLGEQSGLFFKGEKTPFQGDIGAFADVIAGTRRCVYIATGPLTNLARIVEKRPECLDRISCALIMGGGFRYSNSPHQSEFNFHCDPRAARTVIESGLHIVLFPLDLATENPLSAAQVETLCAAASDMPMASLLRFNCRRCMEHGDPGALIHDAYPALFACFPGEFGLARERVRLDRWGHVGTRADGTEITVASGVSETLLFQCLAEALGS